MLEFGKQVKQHSGHVFGAKYIAKIVLVFLITADVKLASPILVNFVMFVSSSQSFLRDGDYRNLTEKAH